MGDGIGRVSLDSHEGLWENQGGLPQRFETLKLNESRSNWYTLRETNGWNLQPQITHLKKGKWSEPNLHDYVQNVNL